MELVDGDTWGRHNCGTGTSVSPPPLLDSAAYEAIADVTTKFGDVRVTTFDQMV